MKNSPVVNFREVMITVILAVLCGFIYFGWGPVWTVVNGILPSGGEVVYGMWFIAAALVGYIVQKPGVALIAEMAAATAEAIMGGQWGLSTLIYGFFQGVTVELVFALFRYRNFSTGVMFFAGAAAAVGSLIAQAVTGGLAEYTTGVLISTIIIRLISGGIFAGVLAKVIADLLGKAGVLNSYKIVRSKLEKPF